MNRRLRKKGVSSQAKPDELTTWVFDDGSFIPAAKLTESGSYSIITDHLGTPVSAYDEEGKEVWARELDIYGRVKVALDEYGQVTKWTGETDFVPFRYQGQYHDVETGLYYNRFRYYDPESGNYTQIDPIGLAGNNSTLYGYVGDPNRHVDSFSMAGVTYLDLQR